MTNNLNLLYVRGMQRPCLLNAYAVGILSYSKGSAGSAALLLQYDTLEYLNTLTVSLFNLAVYLYGISYLELRYFSLQLLSLNVLIISFISLSPPYFLDVLTASTKDPKPHRRPARICLASLSNLSKDALSNCCSSGPSAFYHNVVNFIIGLPKMQGLFRINFLILTREYPGSHHRTHSRRIRNHFPAESCSAGCLRWLR